MCQLSRREVLASAAALSALLEGETAQPAHAEIGKVDPIAPGVYFHEGDLSKGHCNNGWVIFEDYVLVIDANFPSGAKEIIPKIRALTPKPIRFAFDTHHHGDHAYANQVWVEEGAVPVAHTGVVEEMKKYETGYYGGKPGRWEEAAAGRPDVAASKLKPPSLLFPRELIFDDGKQRVELLHLGVAHTHGDAFAWMPKLGILFGGDACVNGPYNFVGDGDTGKWIGTLAEAKKLKASTLCPGHGPRGTGTIVEDQQAYFRSLRSAVGSILRGEQTEESVKEAVAKIEAALKANKQVSRYVGDFLPAQIEKVYLETSGKALPGKRAMQQARHHHAIDHGKRLA